MLERLLTFGTVQLSNLAAAQDGNANMWANVYAFSTVMYFFDGLFDPSQN